MKIRYLISTVAVLIIMGCTTDNKTTEKKPFDLNDTLPKLTVADILPTVSNNEYCQSNLDSDILYGIGYKLYNANKYEQAKACFVMAAPKQTRAFCYLSTITDRDSTISLEQRNKQSFNYTAYAASKNDWCAEYGMYLTYQYGKKGMAKNEELALAWLERSARHGSPGSQEEMFSYYDGNGNLPAAYAWLKLADNVRGSKRAENFKKDMTAEQIADGEKLYNELYAVIPSKQVIYDEARNEDVGLYSAEIYLMYPDFFKDMSSEERVSWVKKEMLTALKEPYINKRQQVVSYLIIVRNAQLKNPSVDILKNNKIVALLKDEKLTVEKRVTQAAKFYK